MNPQAPNPTPADGQPVSDTARRVGPPLVVTSLVLTAALLAWMALAPTAIAGPIDEAPFTVPATLVTPPDDAGCFDVVEGDGTSREHCLDELARPDDGGRYHRIEIWFDADGRLVAVSEDDEVQRLLHVDLETGEVEVLEETSFADPRDEPVVEPAPPDEPPPSEYVYTDGDRVLRTDQDRWEPASDEVVLDLHGPPGYSLEQAALSPDGTWVITVTGRGEVVVAPVDGSAAPYVWADIPGDRWMDLHRAVRWDG